MIGRNNPFNIRYNSLNAWIGQEGNTRGFCNFSTVTFSVRAMLILIMHSYIKKNILTISEIINRFAPSFENNTVAYVSYVCSRMGVFPFDIPCDVEEYAKLISAIAYYETNAIIDFEFILKVAADFKIKPYNKSLGYGSK